MSDVIQELTADLQERLADKPNQSIVSELKVADLREVIEASSSYILDGIRKESTLTAMIAIIGHRVRDKLGKRRDSVRAARIGAFILESFYHKELVKLDLRKTTKKSKYPAYHVDADNDEGLTDLWELLPNDSSDHMPSSEPVEDWESGVHSNGLPLVRHASKRLLDRFNQEEHSILFNVLNKLQRQGWTVDNQMLKWYTSISNDKEKGTFIPEDGEAAYAFNHFHPDESTRAKRSMKLEAESIKKMAKKLKDAEFYHMYTADFRSRLYPCTAYLHEQGSDRAKGLLKFAKGKTLGADGFKWLCIYATNCLGNDKIPIKDRVSFAEQHIVDGSWVKYGQDPLANKGWIDTDKCWSFLACCLEFKRIKEWVDQGNEVEDYVCHLPVYIDGSNNGVQWLTALSKDETVAPHVNLVPQELPGDIYMFIADKCWNEVSDKYDPDLDHQLDTIMTTLSRLKKGFEKKWTKEGHGKLVDKLKRYRRRYKDYINEVSPNYWNRVSNLKQRRKVSKRPVMTLGYGATEFGFKDQIIDDTGKISDHLRLMEYPWARYMGSLMFNICRGNNGMEASLPGPAKLLQLFETMAAESYEAGKKLEWTTPFTNFPVVQQYSTAKEKRIRIWFCGEEISLTIRVMEDQSIAKKKQITSASPNIIHSFDATHLTLTVHACSFQVSTVHDSFGCLPTDMPLLFDEVRQQFCRVTSSDPLLNMLKAQGLEHLMPKLGTLDLTSVIRSDFAFI